MACRFLNDSKLENRNPLNTTDAVGYDRVADDFKTPLVVVTQQEETKKKDEAKEKVPWVGQNQSNFPNFGSEFVCLNGDIFEW